MSASAFHLNEEPLEQSAHERISALAQQNAILRRDNESLAARLEAVRDLQQAGTPPIESDGIQPLYEKILDAAAATLDADFASLQWLDPGHGIGGALKLLGHRGFSAEAVRFWEWVSPASHSVCGAALRAGSRVAVADVQNCDFMAGSEDLETCLHAGIRAIQTTPLLSRSGVVVGMLSTHWREPHDLSAAESRFLDILTRLAADLIESHSRTEKNELLKGIHHRVKNNLQIIVSLMNLQSGRIDDPRVRGSFDETRNRVQSIASIYELLYRSDTFAALDAVEYSRLLVKDIVRSHCMEERMEVEITGSGITLELERAVPFGLLLNELVSNVCKHAFPDHKSGKLFIALHREDGRIVLTVTDNGTGLPADFDYFRASSLGLQLVHSLARQLRADIEIEVEDGTRVIVGLPQRIKEDNP